MRNNASRAENVISWDNKNKADFPLHAKY